MIKESELRIGNYILWKKDNRIAVKQCSYEIFDALSKGNSSDGYPLVLKAEWLTKAGFVENMKYALLPQARQFILALPVNGGQKSELHAFIKSNGECFGRAMTNDTPSSNNFYHMHQLQNLYQALTGEELPIKQ